MILKKVTNNLEKFAHLLNAVVNKRFAYRSVEGWYKDRWTICITQMVGGWGTPSSLSTPILQRRFCPLKLCMEKEKGKKIKYREPFFTVYQRIKSLTRNTYLYNDQRIYYINTDFDIRKKGLFFPEISEENKGSLWSFFLSDMTEEDIRCFLEELYLAADLSDK